MFDHLGLQVSNYEHSKTFYLQALAPLDVALVMEVTAEQTGDCAHAGFGIDGKPSFWISETLTPAHGMHIALTAKSRATVDAFYAAALAAGGRDNGAPGPRPHYHPDYYGAFVLDRDGNNIEAVCRLPV
ncbi:VOC family protein [Dyella tabacisoli]|uniref:VOC family protein n=1 Tax=Dyella tabacisoli TaxID=2282381 RepID=A0A369UT13_9GAMM|nr:VOC family protein [Dyella tabacisoli]RDD83617.1 VOC family protein [Dyella tabacisoli]